MLHIWRTYSTYTTSHAFEITRYRDCSMTKKRSAKCRQNSTCWRCSSPLDCTGQRETSEENVRHKFWASGPKDESQKKLFWWCQNSFIRAKALFYHIVHGTLEHISHPQERGWTCLPEDCAVAYTYLSQEETLIHYCATMLPFNVLAVPGCLCSIGKQFKLSPSAKAWWQTGTAATRPISKGLPNLNL